MKADKKEKKNKERRKQNGAEAQTDRTRFKKGWGRLYVMTENNVVRPENQKKTKKKVLFCICERPVCKPVLPQLSFVQFSSNTKMVSLLYCWKF